MFQRTHKAWRYSQWSYKKNLKIVRALNRSILDVMDFSIGWFIETRNYLKRSWIVNRHPNYERGLRRARGLGQWNLIVGRTQTWRPPPFGPQPLLHALLPFSCEQTKECLYAALYTPSASKGLPRSVGTLDYNPTTVVGLGPRLGSSLHRCKNSCTCVRSPAIYEYTIVNREHTKEWPPMTSRWTMTTVTCLATPRFLDIIVRRRLMIASISSVHARAQRHPLLPI